MSSFTGVDVRGLGPLPYGRTAERALIERADHMLGVAARQVQLLGFASPTNFESELRRMEHDFARGKPREPAFLYGGEAAFDQALPLALDEVARELSEVGEIGRLYAGRALELALEAQLCLLTGSPEFCGLAARRFQVAPSLATEADALAESWLAGPPPAAAEAPDVISDDISDPRSLVRRMREVIGERRLPLRVMVARSLAPLAAIGEGVVQIAPSRVVYHEDVERTVLHEIEGHALPALRAERAPIGLFSLGTARGSDTQEGWALVLEERAGFLGARRKRELALRHVAARSAHRGEGFRMAVDALARFGAPLPVALRVAARAFRGGGLGREASYLPAFVEVRRALSEEPGLEAALSAGRVSVGGARILSAFPELLPP
jgi:hypothetical protein